MSKNTRGKAQAHHLHRWEQGNKHTHRERERPEERLNLQEDADSDPKHLKWGADSQDREIPGRQIVQHREA